jgi:hypothetical protein
MTSHQDISSENYAAKHDKCHKGISQRQETKTALTPISSRDKNLQRKPCDDLIKTSHKGTISWKSQQEFALRHTQNIKSHQTIIQQNATQSHKVIA